MSPLSSPLALGDEEEPPLGSAAGSGGADDEGEEEEEAEEEAKEMVERYLPVDTLKVTMPLMLWSATKSVSSKLTMPTGWRRRR